MFSLNLALQPKNFKSKKRQKNRQLLKFNNKFYLKYGDTGLLLLKSTLFSALQLSRFKLFLKKASKKSDKTKRKIWFNLFPHLPLSKKPANVRMGKGKGKLKTWFINVNGGTIFFEYKNLRYGRFLYFFKQSSFKLGINTVKLVPRYYFFKFFIRTKNNFFFKSFWF